jgi:hypothetical protein
MFKKERRASSVLPRFTNKCWGARRGHGVREKQRESPCVTHFEIEPKLNHKIVT